MQIPFGDTTIGIVNQFEWSNIQLKYNICNYVFIQNPLLRTPKKTSRRRTCYHHHNNKTKCLNAIAQVEYLIRKELLTEECHTCRHQILCFSFSNDFNWMATGMSYRPPIILIRHRHWTEAATGNNIIPESMLN